MALKKIPYKDLSSLIGEYLSTEENSATQELIDELSAAKARGFLKKSELVKICYWKSPRAIHHIKRNRAGTVRTVTGKVFKSRSEQAKLELLRGLCGVSVPMASSILTLTNPKRYGVIDIRVWQLLHTMKSVRKNSNGTGFNFSQWHQYLTIIRNFAAEFKVGARDIERTLFNVHSHYQKGTLYRK